MEEPVSARERSLSRTPWNHRTPLQRNLYPEHTQKEFPAVRLEEHSRLAPHDGKLGFLLGRRLAELAGGRLSREIQPGRHRPRDAATSASDGLTFAGTAVRGGIRHGGSAAAAGRSFPGHFRRHIREPPTRSRRALCGCCLWHLIPFAPLFMAAVCSCTRRFSNWRTCANST